MNSSYRLCLEQKRAEAFVGLLSLGEDMGNLLKTISAKEGKYLLTNIIEGKISCMLARY